MGNTFVRLSNLAIVDVDGHKVFRCKCGHVLCSATEDYKTVALRGEVAISKGQPDYLASKTSDFVLREYYCPVCAAMFEVNMVARGEEQIPGVRLKLP